MIQAQNIFSVTLPIILSFVTCVILMPVLIPLLRRLKFGQSILEIGPNWHAKKSGTPTMGGIGFIVSSILIGLILGFSPDVILAAGFAMLCGIIGFVDDFIKVCLKRNMGFNPKQKTACLIVAILAFMFASHSMGITNTNIYVPFFKAEVDFGFWYFPLVFIMIMATVNSVNLTDGIDGLAASITCVVSVFFAVLAFAVRRVELAYFACALLGSLVAFLIFNLNPAKVFMGDTGSLFLGGALAAIAVLLKQPLIVILVGLIYLIETASVIIQVTFFKLTGKRFFKMSPIHHHFEMCGWKENKIVIVFCTVTIVMCVLAFLSL